MKKRFYCLLLILCPVLPTMAEPPASGKPLRVGDAVPEYLFTNLHNYPTPSAKISAFRGKLLILDFWTTWCGACIDAMPHLQQLQQRFSGKLQVILVNAYPADNAEKVRSCLEKRKARTGFQLTLPYSIQQTKLAVLFPHRFVPHYVWIGANGKVLAITSRDEVTEDNIAAILGGETLRLHTKNDLMEFDATQPLFVAGNGGDGNAFAYRSIITGYQEGLGSRSGVERDKNGKVIRYFMLNRKPLALLREAWPDALIFSGPRLVFQGVDPNVFADDAADGKQRYTNSYCYELIIPPATQKELETWMQQDLQRVFDVAVKKEKRNIDCLVLTKLTGTRPLLAAGGEPFDSFGEGDSLHILRNQTFSQFTDLLLKNSILKQIQLVDETGIHYPVDIECPASFPTLSILQQFLESKGIYTTLTPREMEVSVIYRVRPL